MLPITCTCGETGDHVVMRRRTADGKEVELWASGCLTGALGFGIRGVPFRRPRTVEARERALKAGRLTLEWISVYDANDLPEIYRAAERTAEKRARGETATLTSVLRDMRAVKERPVVKWTVLRADNRGQPVERVASLPRLRWPDYVIWDFCSGPHSSRGRYHLMKRHADDRLTVDATGWVFRNLDEVFAHLQAM